MNKSKIADTLKREISYRLELIKQCQNGDILVPDTEENRSAFIEEQFTKIDEVHCIAGKLRVNLN
jgi:hypothetical protein